MIGRIRPLVLWSSGTRRLVVGLVLVALVLLFLLPRQTQFLLQHLGKPVSDLIGVPLTLMADADQGLHDWWNQYVALQDINKQNRELKKKIQELRGN